MKNQPMKKSTLLFVLLIVGSTAFSQTWDLTGCNCDTIAYPFENGRGTTKFPEGSCPPPHGIVKCFNNSKIKPIKAESQSHETYYTHIPDYAIDDYMVTRWSAGDYIDNQWFQVDLGEEKTFRRIFLTWELAYATDYDIQISNDKINWKTVSSIRDSDGFVDAVTVNEKARYIRMQGLKKSNNYGMSLFDFTICAEVE